MKWKEKNIMQFLPWAKASSGCRAFFFSGVDEELRFLPAALTPKEGLIMWSSTVRLIEMLSLILSPASNAFAVFGVFLSTNLKGGNTDLLTYHADSSTPDRMILYEYRCGGA